MGGRFGQRRDGYDMLVRSHQKLSNVLDELMADLGALSEGRGNFEDSILGHLSFLENQVMRHEEDEEVSVFPKIAKKHGTLVAKLTKEHKFQRATIGRLSEICQSSTKAQLRAQRCMPLAQTLRASYRAHIALEDAELLPAIKALSVASQREITSEMHARRPRS